MKKLLWFMITIYPFMAANCQSKKSSQEINNYIAEVQKQYHIPGLALAVIKDGKVVHQMNYGIANIENSVPVNDDTLFPLFSTTKVFSVLAVHQLIAQKKLSLDSKISEFLSDLPDSWKSAKIENLLTHSSGLPDIVDYENEDIEEIAKNKVYKDSIKFVAGNQFDYNQTNFWLLNRVIKKITGRTLAEYIVETQFLSSGSPAIFEGNSLKIVKNLTYGYVTSENRDSTFRRNWHFPVYMYGTAGLNLSLNSFIEWNKKLDDGVLISEAVKKQLLKPYIYKQERDFCYGLDLIKTDGKLSYGFSGGVATAFRKFPDQKITIILLANGMFIPSGKLRGINEVVNNIEKLSEKI